MWLIIVALLLTLKLFQFTEALVTWVWGGDGMIIFGTLNIQTKKGESERFLLGGWRFVSVLWVPRSKEESPKKCKRFMKWRRHIEANFTNFRVNLPGDTVLGAQYIILCGSTGSYFRNPKSPDKQNTYSPKSFWVYCLVIELTLILNQSRIPSAEVMF